MSPTWFHFCLKAAAFLPCPGKRLAVAVIHPNEGVTPSIVAPLEGRLNRSSRHPGPVKQVECGTHDRALHIHIPGLPAGISQRKVRKHESGDTALFDDVPSTAHDYGRNPVRLQMPGNQTHGLVAHRSKSREKRGVHAIFTAPFKDSGGIAL